MPRRRRLVKGRRDRLTNGQRLELLTGHAWFACPGVPEEAGFGDDETARRAAWEAYREQLLVESEAEGQAGRRPWGWWRYDAPEPRDKHRHETLQLLALGEIGTAEREALKPTWLLYERQASEVRKVYGEAAYWEQRRHYGIPDTWRPLSELAGEYGIAP